MKLLKERGWLLNDLSVPERTLSFVEQCYNQKHRHFHTVEHLDKIISRIKSRHEGKALRDLGTEERRTYTLNLVHVALFHDIVYAPWEKRERHGVRISDEKASSEVFLDHVRESQLPLDKDLIEKTIIQTNNHDGTDEFSYVFNRFDMEILESGSLSELMEYEHQIFREYSFNRLDLYIKYRCEFLENLARINGNDVLFDLAEYVRTRPYKVAFYPGSFAPFHRGHLDVLEKAEKIFDKVLIIQGVNHEKTESFGSNLHTMKELKSREVCNIHGNIIEEIFGTSGFGSIYSKYNPTMVRGVRNSHDLLYEDTYIEFCKELHPSLQHVLILCDHSLSHISSSSMRGLRKMKGNSENVYKKYIVE